MLNVDALSDVFDALVHPPCQEVDVDEVSEGQLVNGLAAREKALARRQQRRVEREGPLSCLLTELPVVFHLERKRIKRRAREAEIHREILRNRVMAAYKKLRIPVNLSVSSTSALNY